MFQARTWSSVSGTASSSCCLSMNALLRSSFALASACSNSAVAASPNWAFANPSSCSLVLTASSVSTRAADAWRSSSSTLTCGTGAGPGAGSARNGLRRRRRMRSQTMPPMTAAMRTKASRPVGNPEPPVPVPPPVACRARRSCRRPPRPRRLPSRPRPSCGWIWSCRIVASCSSVRGPDGSEERKYWRLVDGDREQVLVRAEPVVGRRLAGPGLRHPPDS